MFNSSYDLVAESGKRKPQRRQRKKVRKNGKNLGHYEVCQNYALFCNVKDKDYSNTVMKTNGLQAVQYDLENGGIIASVEDIQSRMHSLRVYFTSQKSKYEGSIRSSMGIDGVYYRIVETWNNLPRGVTPPM